MKGNKVKFRSPADALNNGISMIHQEISLVQEMDVAENIWLGREGNFKKHGLLDRKARNAATENCFRSWRLRLMHRRKFGI